MNRSAFHRGRLLRGTRWMRGWSARAHSNRSMRKPRSSARRSTTTPITCDWCCSSARIDRTAFGDPPKLSGPCCRALHRRTSPRLLSWVPQLFGTQPDAVRASRLIDDPRAIHYWDGCRYHRHRLRARAAHAASCVGRVSRLCARRALDRRTAAEAERTGCSNSASAMHRISTRPSSPTTCARCYASARPYASAFSYAMT